MDSLMEKIDAALVAGGEHGTRISSLERWRAWTIGLSAGISLVMSVLGTLATLFLKFF